MGKLFLPGVSGVAQVLPALVLRLKGMRIVGMQPLDLPSNWLLLHPGLRKKVILSIYNRCSKIVTDFAEKLISGKPRYKALVSLPIDVALIPIALGYYFVGRFFLAKTLIATDACNNCGRCIDQCPVSAIKMVNQIPYWSLNCESCMRCVNRCPQRAIETTQTYSGLLAFLSYAIVSPLIFKGLKSLGIMDWMNQSELAGSVSFIFDSLILIGIVFLGYKIIHALMRFRIVNKIITYTSFSKYKFWRRYKPPKFVPRL
jgi:ferredoxin